MNQLHVQINKHSQHNQKLQNELDNVVSQLKTMIKNKGIENAKKDIKGKQLALKKKQLEKQIKDNEGTIDNMQKFVDNQLRIDSVQARQSAIRSQTTQMKSLVSKRKRQVEFRALENITVHDSLEPTKSFKKRKSNQTLNSGSLFILDQGNRPITRPSDNTQMIHIRQINTDNPITGFIKTSKKTEPSLQGAISGTTAASKKKKRTHHKKKKKAATHHKKKKKAATHHKKKKKAATHHKKRKK